MARWRSLAAACLLTSALPSALASPARADSADSLKCDGAPTQISPGELIGRALLLTATLGIAGRPPQQDVSQRARGLNGVAACDAAMLEERAPIRKVQLMLARAVHHIEASDYAAALDDARKAPDLAGPAAADIGFRHSLYLSSLDLQAASLVRARRYAEAEAVALTLADTAPYDVTAQVEVVPYMMLVEGVSPQKQAYLDRLVRIFPQALAARAIVYEWAGRYLDAAADYASIVELRAAFSAGTMPPPPDALALRAAMLAMGGKLDEAAAQAADAAALIRVLTASGKGGVMQSPIDSAEQALDFQSIVADLAAGRASAARVKFAARSHWSIPAPASVADLAARLRQGARPEELTGALAADPAATRANALVSNAGAITEANNADTALFAIIRPPMTEATYRDWAGDAWDTKASPFLHKKVPGDEYLGELMVAPRSTPRFMTAPRALSVAAGDALLLYAAVLAQSRGQKSFELLPARADFEAIFMKFGNPGDPGMVAATSFDAATVVSDLSAEFPQPRARTGGDGAAQQPRGPF